MDTALLVSLAIKGFKFNFAHFILGLALICAEDFESVETDALCGLFDLFAFIFAVLTRVMAI